MSGRALRRLLGGAVLVYALLAVAGLVLTRGSVAGPLLRTDHAVSTWFFEHRTPALDTWTHLGSSAADTLTAITVTAVLVVGLRLWLGRWRESVTALLSIAGELFIFVLVTATVHRQRPTVPHLDPAPPTSSFPSGHTGASVALYVGLAAILLIAAPPTGRPGGAGPGAGGGRARPAWVLVAAPVLCVVPVLVALSRVYRGMHFPTDVVAGALAGGLWTAIVVVTLLGPYQPTRPTRPTRGPAGAALPAPTDRAARR